MKKAELNADGKEILDENPMDTTGLDTPKPLKERLPEFLKAIKFNVQVKA